MKLPSNSLYNISITGKTSATMNGGGYAWSSTRIMDSKLFIGSTSNPYHQMTGTYTDTGDISYLFLRYGTFASNLIMPLEFFSCGATPDAVVEQQTVA